VVLKLVIKALGITSPECLALAHREVGRVEPDTIHVAVVNTKEINPRISE
jgi:hypothetical protein